MTPQPIMIDSSGRQLLGMVHPGGGHPALGMVILVGGPQYRIGSHRQFLLLARDLAEAGVPALRFDYSGMGDSEGEARNFDASDDDIRAAIDAFYEHQPSLRCVVLWGLCDAASAAMLYASQDKRVRALVLANPWVRTEAGLAQARLKHYYLQRLFSRDFAKKLLSGQYRLFSSLASFGRQVKQSLPGRNRDASFEQAEGPSPSLPDRMLSSLSAWNGPLLIMLSGQDLVAREFEDLLEQSPDWQERLNRDDVRIEHLQEANHTFSSRAWRDQISVLTRSFLRF